MRDITAFGDQRLQADEFGVNRGRSMRQRAFIHPAPYPLTYNCTIAMRRDASSSVSHPNPA